MHLARPKVLLIGNGGRESALAWRLADDCAVYALCSHRNPTLDRLSRGSGGTIRVGTYTSPTAVCDFARESRVDFVFVSNEEALAGRVVDVLVASGIPTIGPTRAGAEIEWNKAYARKLLQAHMPEWNPAFWIVDDLDHARSLFKKLSADDVPVAVKPQGLTAGKGVRVMGNQLATHEDAFRYCERLLAQSPSDAIVIEERLDGVEFTVQGITDGRHVVRVPATYDYVYRYDGDKGPVTGGMGSFAGPGRTLNFLTPAEYDSCVAAMERVLTILEEGGRVFNGVLNASFFATPNGLKVTELNGRFGDPECINIMSMLTTPLLPLCEAILSKRLSYETTEFCGLSSVVKYLVPPEYSVDGARTYDFDISLEAIRYTGAEVFFSSSEVHDTGFRTVGASRTLAIAKMAETSDEASQHIESCLANYVVGDLQHRQDIGSAAYVDTLPDRLLRTISRPQT